MLYDRPDFLLTDNDLQFELVSMFIKYLCLYIRTKLLTTTAQHPKTNGQTEPCNKMIATIQRHYVNEHQNDWDAFEQPLP